MSTQLAIILITHIIVGLAGVFLFGAVAMNLMKRHSSVRMLRWASLLGFLSFIISWIAGGYYYVIHYGSQVKPIIKSGDMSWVHAVIMETKEHVFLFLPSLAFVVTLGVWLIGDRLSEMPKLKKAIMLVLLIAFIIGVFVALSGVVISGVAVK